MPKIKTALISVYDKQGIVDFARKLSEFGITIISTGGTSELFRNNGIGHRQVEEITRFPECLEGRVKTLHPHVFMGILARRNRENHLRTLSDQGVAAIDMVVVNLYPFSDTVSRQGVTPEEAVEQIDIGGVALLRAAAKNYQDTVAVASPDKYDEIAALLGENDCSLSESYSLSCASAVFGLTSGYDALISGYLQDLSQDGKYFPEKFPLFLEKVQDLRYGENPHQKAALYQGPGERIPYTQLSGKELSFNNLIDIDSAVSLSHEYDRPAVAIIKHTNPCGVGIGDNLPTAFDRALATDPVSAFGGIIGLNRSLDAPTAEKIFSMFVEVVAAPGYDAGVLELLSKKKNVRILKIDENFQVRFRQKEIKTIRGGFLIQDNDAATENPSDFTVVTKRKPTQEEWEGLLFGWRLVRYVKSNAVIYCSRDRTLGIGTGQPSRVDASEIAIMKARKENLDVRGSVVISDAFFPFRDGVDVASRAGATAVIQPGGSIRDKEVIAAAEEHDMAMVFTGVRHFRH